MQKQLFSKTAARAPRAAQWVAVDRSEMPVTVPALDGTFDSHVVGRKAGSMLQLQIATNLWAPFKRHKNESDPAMQLRILPKLEKLRAVCSLPLRVPSRSFPLSPLSNHEPLALHSSPELTRAASMPSVHRITPIAPCSARPTTRCSTTSPPLKSRR